MNYPTSQWAIQLVGPGEVVLNKVKPVPALGPHQILCQTEAVGLCFSDMKLLKQFSGHVRKAEAISGPALDVLHEIQSYVPGDKPTVPGHEAAVRVVAVGSSVRHYQVGQRWIVQADYRNLKTPGANCALGYDFEGGLQEFILMDERVIGDPNGSEGYMIAADEAQSASALALVEPWACVERAYVTQERRALKPGGRLLVVVDEDVKAHDLTACLDPGGKPAELWVSGAPEDTQALASLGIPGWSDPSDRSDTPTVFDDIVYFGSDASTIESLDQRLAPGGILNLVLGGEEVARSVALGIGRAHYGNMRWIGTVGHAPEDSYRMVPETGELRTGDRLLVVGAGGPMGQMHAIRALSSGIRDLHVTATDIDDERLAALASKVEPLVKGCGGRFETVNTRCADPGAGWSYVALMAPVPALVADGVERAAAGAIVNVFAGIPATVTYPLDLNGLIANRIYILGTSGSEIEDMASVYRKLVDGRLDTDLSVGAICGMAGAKEGLDAVESRSLDGKIIVYPMLHDLGLVPLAKLTEAFPSVAAKLNHGGWCKAAEDELLLVAGTPP